MNRYNNVGLFFLLTQVWVTKKNLGKKLEDIPIPSSDVMNLLDEVHFEDQLTRSRCRGWLVLPSRRYLQADILFPGCEFDCRLTIRERSGMLWHEYLCCLCKQCFILLILFYVNNVYIVYVNNETSLC